MDKVITQAAELFVLVVAAGMRTRVGLSALWPALVCVGGTDRCRRAVFYGPGGLYGGESLLEMCLRAGEHIRQRCRISDGPAYTCK